MFRGKAIRALFILLAIPGRAFCQDAGEIGKCDSARSVAPDDAQKQVIEKGPVQIPPLAKAVRMQGTVRVEVCVSKAGAVIMTKPMGGPPLLVGAALESARAWRFKPDTTGPFRTVLDISFSLGSTPAEIANEEAASNLYFAEDKTCREQLRANQLDQALESCGRAVALAGKLPKERSNERRTAWQMLGHVYFNQRKFQDARRSYETELKIALSSLHPYDAELGYAYHDVAVTLHSMGNTADAAEDYRKAEETILLARDHIAAEFLKREYTATLNKIRQHYLILLQQTGQTAAAADLDERIRNEAK